MSSGGGKDGGELESQADDSSRPPDGPARSGIFGRYTLSGVIGSLHNIVNKVSGRTVSPPPMTAGSSTRSQEVDQTRSSELSDRSDTQPLSLYQMKLRGMSSDESRVCEAQGGLSDAAATGHMGTPLLPRFNRGNQQFRQESSSSTKSPSSAVIQYPSSPHSGPVGQMPSVHLSPRRRPPLIISEDRVKPVTVKIARPDPLRTPVIRHPSDENPNNNNSSNSHASVPKETVADALKKRKRSHMDPDENDPRDTEDRDQTSKRRCSRADEISVPETAMSRGMKRRALHDESGYTDETADQSPDVVEGAVKKICQNASPPSRRFGCGARNVIDASYSSYQRWQERRQHGKSTSRAASSCQDESMPLVDDGRPASSRASHCSSHFSRADSPALQDENLRLGYRLDRTHLIQSGGRSTPNSVHADSMQRTQLLFGEGGVKNRVTMLSTHSASPSVTPSLDLEAQLAESSEFKAPVEFTADDLERDRDLLNSRASRLLLGLLDADDDKTDSVLEQASTTVPLPGTGALGPGMASTAFQATEVAAPPSSTAPPDYQVQTNPDSRIASVLKSKVDSAADPVSQGLSISTSAREKGGFAGSITASAGLNFGPSTAVASPSAISVISVSSTGTLPTTQDSSGIQPNPGMLSGDSSKGFTSGISSFGTFLTPASGTSEAGKPGGANAFNGFGRSTVTTTAAVTTASVAPSFGTVSNMQAAAASFASTSNAALTTTAPLSSTLLGMGDSRANPGFFGNTAGGLPAFGNSTIAATTATKDAAPITTGGFTFSKISSTQANADNLGNAKSLAVTAQTAATGLSFGNSSAAQATTSSLSFGNAGPAQATANSFAFGSLGSAQTPAGGFSFPNSGASQTTNSDFTFGNSGKTQTAASSVAFGNLPATQTAAGSILFGNSGPMQAAAGGFTFGNLGAPQTTASSFATGTTQPAASSFPFGNSGTASTTAGSFSLGFSGVTQTTAGSFSFAGSGATQATTSGSSFGNAGITQTTASSFSFGNLRAPQPSTGGFTFGSSNTNPTTGNILGGAPAGPATAGGFGFGNSSSKQMAGGAFGNSGNAPTTASSGFTGIAASPQFGFGNSSAPTTANPSTAGGFAFGNVQQPQAGGSNLATANPFGNSMQTANAFGSNPPNIFSSNPSTGNAFGSNVATANTFGSNTATSSFGSNVTTANTFGSTQPPSNPFSSSTAAANPFGGSVATANPFGTPNSNFDNKSSGLQFNRPDVAATNQSTPQDLRRVLFPSTPASNPTPVVSQQANPSQQQQQPGFNFFGSKTDGNSNSLNTPGGFPFGKSPAPAPTFGSNSTAGGFAFGKTTGGNPQQPTNPSFNFQGAPQSGTNLQNPGFGFNTASQPATNSQTQNSGFNFPAAAQPGTNPPTQNPGFSFNASTTNFAFGQMPNPPANGLPSISSFSAGPKFTPGTTYGSSSGSSTRNLRKKKGR